MTSITCHKIAAETTSEGLIAIQNFPGKACPHVPLVHTLVTYLHNANQIQYASTHYSCESDRIFPERACAGEGKGKVRSGKTCQVLLNSQVS